MNWALIRSECSAKREDERGIALISVLLLIMVLSFVSAAAIVTSTTDLKIGENFRTSLQSFYNADAGVQYAMGQIQKRYADAGAPNITGSQLDLHYSAPGASIYPLLSNGRFPFSNWTTTHLYRKSGSTTDYMFQTTGYYANSNTSLQIIVNTSSMLPFIVSWKQL
jgi:Tfp pilus assembly protein PilX